MKKWDELSRKEQHERVRFWIMLGTIMLVLVVGIAWGMSYLWEVGTVK